jgi:carbonic anhydrase
MAAAPTKLHEEVLAANAAYAATFGAKSELAMPPARRAAFLVCMDARLDVAKFAGLSEGDAHVIRNAGGRADDSAIRSFVISHKLLATNEWFVVHHTDCGMEFFTSEHMGEILSTSLATAKHNGTVFANVSAEGGAPDGKFVNWLTINHGQAKAVTEDVHRIAKHPLVAPGIPLHGYVYNVKSGKLEHILSVVTRA